MRDHLTLPAAEVRFAADEATGIISGHAALFNRLVPGYREKVLPGAFARTIAERASSGTALPMLWGHDPDQPIGLWTSLVEDESGLHVTGRILTGTSRGKDALALVAGGAMSGLSIGFRARQADRHSDGIRLIRDIDLAEISLTPFPAQPGAKITSLRNATNFVGLAAFLAAASRAVASIKV